MVNSHFESEFEQLFKQNFKKLCSYAMSYIRDEETARDITHDVFITLWNKREQLDFSLPLYPYLVSLVRNRCINYLEHLKVEQKHKEKSTGISYEELLDKEDHEELINDIIRQVEILPAKCREVMKLCFVENKKYKEIAEELNISVNTVKTHLATGLKTLRERYSNNPLIMMFLLEKINFDF